MKVRVILPVALVVGMVFSVGTSAKAFELFRFGGDVEACKGEPKGCDEECDKCCCTRPCLLHACAVGLHNVTCNVACNVKCQVEHLQCRLDNIECRVHAFCDAIKARLCHPFCCCRCCDPCCVEKGCEPECAAPQK